MPKVILASFFIDFLDDIMMLSEVEFGNNVADSYLGSYLNLFYEPKATSSLPIVGKKSVISGIVEVFLV